jgi:hypothetical protein
MHNGTPTIFVYILHTVLLFYLELLKTATVLFIIALLLFSGFTELEKQFGHPSEQIQNCEFLRYLFDAIYLVFL